MAFRQEPGSPRSARQARQSPKDFEIDFKKGLIVNIVIVKAGSGDFIAEISPLNTVATPRVGEKLLISGFNEAGYRVEGVVHVYELGYYSLRLSVSTL